MGEAPFRLEVSFEFSKFGMPHRQSLLTAEKPATYWNTEIEV